MSRVEGNLTGANIKVPRVDGEFADIQHGNQTLSPRLNGNLEEAKRFCSDVCGPQREKIQGLLGGMCAREALLVDTENKTPFVRRAGQIACIECAASRMNGGPIPIYQLRKPVEA